MVDRSSPAPMPAPRPATSGDPLVVLEKVNKHFGALHVLQDVDLTVHRGEVVVVIGPSGSGKSTLCRTINRLETIDSGTHRHRRQAAARGGQGAGPAAGRRRDGVPVLQPLRAQVGPRERHARAGQGQGRQARGGRARTRWRCSSGSAWRTRPSKLPAQLSGGQQQRVAIARALAMKPEGHAVRRADLGAGPRDDQRGPRRHGLPRARRHDDGRRHPRDGLRPQGREPGRVHGRRPIVEEAEPETFFTNPRSDRAQDFLSKILTH